MSAPSRNVSGSGFPQRIAGAILVLIASVLIVCDATGTSLSPNACATLLLSALVIIAFAVHKTKNRWTSLIGLFFLGTLVFVAPRPLVALVTQDDSVYTLLFGQLVEPRGPDLSRLLAFWTIGIASLFGGYFLFFRDTPSSMTPLSDAARTYCKRSFLVAFIIVVILLPVLVHKRFVAFATGGYAGLYLSQTESSFSLLPILIYLAPALYALAVLIGEKRYTRLMVFAVMSYAFCGILFGRRIDVGTWLLVALWHFSTIRSKPIRMGYLLAGFALIGYTFQWIQIIRDPAQRGNVAQNSMLVDFFISQGITFMVPALAWQLPTPPLHTILGSLLSMRHFYRVLGIGTIETANIVDYVTSHGSPALFEAGNGLDTSAFLDIFYVCGQVMSLYALVCGLLGILLRKWEARAKESRIALFFLCICLPSIFFVQRATVFSVTSPIFYLSLFMVVTYILHLCVNLVELNMPHANSSAPQSNALGRPTM
jgi:hypothetical protein